MSYLSRTLRERSLDTLAEALEEGTLTSEALCEEALAAATDGRRPDTQVFIDLNPERVRVQAQVVDLLRGTGQAPSRFAGIPISIKDLADVAGEVTAAGSRIHAESPSAKQDSTAVSRLRAAGFVIFGRTNMTEYAYSGIGLNPHYGTAGNARDATRVPGGSTSGGAVSVGLGMAAAALGSDTNGSVRGPAALNGLAGFKPTASSVPTDGVFPLSSTLDSIGPLAPTVSCCATLHGVFSNTAPKQTVTAPVNRLRIGVAQGLPLEGLDATVAAAYARALTALDRAGCELIEFTTDIFETIDGLTPRINFAAAEGYAVHRDNIARCPDDFDFRVRNRMRMAEQMTASDYVDLLTIRSRVWAEYSALTAGFDAVIMPTSPFTAPTLASVEADVDEFMRNHRMILRNTGLINWLDGCAATIPVQAPDEQGVGLMVSGVTGADWAILQIAEILEAVVRVE